MDTTRFSLRHLLPAARCDVSHLWGVKLAMVCILCTLLACGCVTAMPSSHPSSYGDTIFCIELEGDIGLCQDLQLNNIYYATDNYDHSQIDDTWLYYDLRWEKKENLCKKGNKIIKKLYVNDFLIPENLTNESFSEIRLTMTLHRMWGFSCMWHRLDAFHLDVTELYEIPSDHVVCIPLKISHSYKCFKSDSVTIKDRNNNTLIYFAPTSDPNFF